MARLTDPDKLIRIKNATIELITRHGYQGVTTAKIAEVANVSTGYLYHHYESKDQLVCDIIEECHLDTIEGIGQLVQEGVPFEAIIQHVYRVLLSMANVDPKRAAFVYVVSHDPYFAELVLANSKINVVAPAELLLEYGLKNGAVSPDTTIVDMIVFFIDLPIGYVYSRILESNGSPEITESEILRLADRCAKALK